MKPKQELFDSTQLKQLEQYFKHTPYPSDSQLEDLCRNLQLPNNTVNKWFMKRRKTTGLSKVYCKYRWNSRCRHHRHSSVTSGSASPPRFSISSVQSLLNSNTPDGTTVVYEDEISIAENPVVERSLISVISSGPVGDGLPSTSTKNDTSERMDLETLLHVTDPVQMEKSNNNKSPAVSENQRRTISTNGPNIPIVHGHEYSFSDVQSSSSHTNGSSVYDNRAMSFSENAFSEPMKSSTLSGIPNACNNSNCSAVLNCGNGFSPFPGNRCRPSLVNNSSLSGMQSTSRNANGTGLPFSGNGTSLPFSGNGTSLPFSGNGQYTNHANDPDNLASSVFGRLNDHERFVLEQLYGINPNPSEECLRELAVRFVQEQQKEEAIRAWFLLRHQH